MHRMSFEKTSNELTEWLFLVKQQCTVCVYFSSSLSLPSSGVFRNLSLKMDGTGGKFQMYIFCSVQIFAQTIWCTLKISTNLFSPPRGGVSGASPLP